MALGKRKSETQELWVATTELPRSPGHPFYKHLNRLLAEDGFDRWLEKLCRPYYHATQGRPSIPPGVYFRMILVGYFEGISSQRGIAWRCCDSRSLAEFLGFGPTEETPDHSSLSRVAQRLPTEVHEAVFGRVLAIAVAKGLVHGKTVVATAGRPCEVAVDSTTLEANAAMKSIVRRDSGEDWKEYVTRLMRDQGVIEADETPSDEEVRRFDKQRKNKRTSHPHGRPAVAINNEWGSTTDPESRITRMKDGTTHLAYKAEHVVDLESEFLLAATVHGGDAADTETMVDSVVQAELNLQAAGSEQEIEETVADKGYHSAANLELCQSLGVRTYVPEPKRNHQSRWTDKPEEYKTAVYSNRRRIRGARSKRLQRLRSERVERSFAHVCETGGARRCWLTSLAKVSKRYLLQAAARNLGLILRKLFGMGTPRGLQGEGALAELVHLIILALRWTWRFQIAFLRPNVRCDSPARRPAPTTALAA
jgi:transposase